MKVELLTHFGSDLMVVNVAKVSYNKESEEVGHKEERLLKFLAEHKHTCYDDNTEVFTDKGWKLFSQLDRSDKIAAVNNRGAFRFEVPSNYYSSDYDGDLIYIESNHIDLAITQNHNLWVSKRYKNRFGDFEMVKAIDFLDKQYRFQTTANFLNDTEEGTFDEGVLYGFFLGDGFRASANTVCFRLKKERKINLLTKTLNNLGISYSLKKDNDVSVIRFINNDPDFNGHSGDKEITENKFKKSLKYLSGLFFGLMNSDGSLKRKTSAYSTNSEKLKNDLIRLGTLLGKNIRENKKAGDSYRLMELNRSLFPRINEGKKHNKIKKYIGKIHCVEVSTGLLLVRRNGRQAVCGNSPFRHPQLQFRVECPIFVERQLFTHQIGWARNSISGRYVDFSDTYWIPERFRYQSKDSKQGSAGELSDEDNQYFIDKFNNIVAQSQALYKEMSEFGIAKELCRVHLPLALETKFIWTGSFHAFTHLCSLRLKPDAQKETRDCVGEMLQAVKNIPDNPFKFSLSAFGL